MSATLLPVSLSVPRTRPDLDTGRNKGPSEIPAASSQVFTASTGLRCRPCGTAILVPLPFLVGLALPDSDPQPVVIVGEVRHIEPDQLGSAKAAARELGTDDDPERFEETVRKVGAATPAQGAKPKPANS